MASQNTPRDKKPTESPKAQTPRDAKPSLTSTTKLQVAPSLTPRGEVLNNYIPSPSPREIVLMPTPVEDMIADAEKSAKATSFSDARPSHVGAGGQRLTLPLEEDVPFINE